MRPDILDRLRDHGVAVILVAAATALRLQLDVVWSDKLPTLLFYVAVSVAAWLGGLGPGLLATALSTAAIVTFWPPAEPSELVGLGILLAFGVLVSYLDERRRRQMAAAAAALRASEQRYRGLVDRNVAGIFRSRVDGTMLDGNPALVRLLGYTSREVLLAHNAEDFYVNAQDRKNLVAGVRRGEVAANRELRWRRADGSAVTVLVNVREVEPNILEGIAIDISDRARALAAEQAATELRAITKLANAAAHEINNPLTVVIGNLALLQREVGARPHMEAAARASEEIRDIVDRMQHITRVELFDQDPALGEVLDIRKSSAT